MLVAYSVGVQAGKLIPEFCLRGRGIGHGSEPLFYADRLDLVEVMIAPLRQDVPFEVFEIALDGRGRPIRVRASEFLRLEVTPEFPDRHFPDTLFLGVDLGAEVLYLTLHIRLSGKTLSVADGLLPLNAAPIVLKLSPAIDPYIWAVGARNACD